MPTNAYTTAIKAQSNLLAYWELAETAGTSGTNSVIDQTGNNDGTPTSMTFGGTGTFPGNSVYASFNGSSSYIDCGAATNLSFTASSVVSIEGWIYPGSSTYFNELIGKYTSDSAPGWRVLLGDYGGSGYALQLLLSNNANSNNCINVLSSYKFTLSTWNHFVITYSGSGTAAGVQFYINGEYVTGVDQGTTLTGAITNSADVQIGAIAGGTNWTGYMSNISITNSVMSPRTVSNHFALGYNIKSISQTSVPVIFDSDGNIDIDDYLALGCLHYMQNHNECTILAVMSDSGNSPSANAAGSPQVFNVINTFYNRPSIPIGRYSGAIDTGGPSSGTDWNTDIPANYTNAGVPVPGVALYRQTLAAQAANSVTIVITGIHTLLAGLLASAADGYSSLNGVALVAAKCAALVVMGGYEPSTGTAEYNMYTDPADAAYTFANWPSSVPIYLSGNQVGVQFTPGVLAGMALTNTSPIRKILQDYGALSTGRQAFDETAALYAVRGNSWNGNAVWTLTQGTNVVNSSTGVNTFTAGAGNMFYLTPTTFGQQVVAGMIDNMEIELPFVAEFTPNYLYSSNAISQPVDMVVLTDDI